MNAGSWLNHLPASHQWRALALARGPRIATWALALALGVQAATIVTDLAGGGQSRKAELRPPSPANVARHGIDIASITNGHLFGIAADPAKSGNAANATQTSMQLVLTGIIAGKDPNVGFAIVGENATAAKVHAVGDNVPGGAKLHSVYSDRVLLDRNGHLEYLSLPRQSSAALNGNPIPAAVPSQNPAFDRVRRLISEDPSALNDIMRNQPVLMQGKLRGFRVYPGRNRQAFTRLGLRSGDLVIAINGTPLDDPARGDEIFRTIGSASEARVTVMRNGQQQDLSLNMSQVAQEAEQAIGEPAAPTSTGPPDVTRQPSQVPMPQVTNPPAPPEPPMPQPPDPEGNE
ncbi:MAG TPA: type II secretion system protein GspC [Steroidobacteraceae bacterium]|jgi:general secretion pathway protein C|nr:type II secretion system protein GspC [Steroidobacteraceae bacterium]